MKTSLLVLGAILTALAFPPLLAAEDRLEAARAELESARQTLTEVEVPRDRELWERRVKALQQEIDNLQRHQALKAKERQVTSRHVRSDYQTLIEAVGAIDSDLTDVNRSRVKADQQLKVVSARRDEDRATLRTLDPNREADYAAIADLEAQIKNLEAEIMALTFARNQADLSIRLRLEAARLGQTLKQSLIQASPSLREVIENRSTLASSQRILDEFLSASDNVRLEKTQAVERLALARERAAQAGAEADNLKELYALERRSSLGSNSTERTARLQRLNRMLSSAKSEAGMLAPRIEQLAKQVAILDTSLNLAEQGADLIRKELGFRQTEAKAIRQAFFRKLGSLGLCLLVILLIEALIARLILPLTTTHEHLLIARRLVRYVALIVMAGVTARFFLEDLRSVATVLGLATAAAVIALQDLCSSFVGWFVIAISRRIKVGDHVEISGIVGDIVDIQILRTTLLECRNWLGTDDHTGRVVLIPNNFIFKEHLFNYSYAHPFVWHRLDITVTYETPVEEARTLLLEILKEETSEIFAEFQKGDQILCRALSRESAKQEPKVNTLIADSGVQFSLFFPAHYRKVSSTRSRICQRILAEFSQRPKLQFAYPTQRLIPTPETAGFRVEIAKPG
jgi:small-conductance mechanosensitive channel